MDIISRELINIAKTIISSAPTSQQEYRRLFQKKFIDFGYEYLRIEVINKKKYIVYICPFHGQKKIRCDCLTNTKFGCKKCQALSRKIPIQEFIQLGNKIHHGKYTYDHVQYQNLHQYVNITCPFHGDFSQLAYSHIFLGRGCKQCHEESFS